MKNLLTGLFLVATLVLAMIAGVVLVVAFVPWQVSVVILVLVFVVALLEEELADIGESFYDWKNNR